MRLLLLIATIHCIAAQRAPLGSLGGQGAGNADKLRIFYGDDTVIGEFPFMASDEN